jgi:hypothetical protein
MKKIICIDCDGETYYITRKNTLAQNCFSKNSQDAYIFMNLKVFNNSLEDLISWICFHTDGDRYYPGNFLCDKVKLDPRKFSNLRTVDVECEIKLTDKETIHEIKRKQVEIIINSEELKSRSFWNPFSK